MGRLICLKMTSINKKVKKIQVKRIRNSNNGKEKEKGNRKV